MKLRNRIAFHFVTRLFLLIATWIVLLIICIVCFSFFLEQKQPASSALPMKEIANNTYYKNGEIHISREYLNLIREKRYWLQILDRNGEELMSIDKPKNIPKHYTPGMLVSDYIYPAKNGYQLSTWSDKKANSSLTWILGKQVENNNPFLFWLNNLWIIFMMVSGVAVAIFFGKSFGAPLLHVVSWIENLSKGKYIEPINQNGLAKSRNKNGNLRTGFKTYQELMDSLQDLTEILKINKQKREQLESTREEWMTGVSHDLKTPLSVIKGYTILLSSKDHEWNLHKTREFANIMQERIEYMEHLIEDFNITFRLKNNALPLSKEKENIVDVLRETTISLTQLPESKDKDFQFNSEEELIELYIDTTYLKRAFENLIANSIKHNPPYTNIKISISKEIHHKKQIIKIVIEDDGIGMENEVIERLFDRYFRGTNSTNYTGTGLGMAISRQIILAHDGNINIESKLHQGTKFIVTFPYNRIKYY